jgi:hypothetical protein
VMIRKEGGSDGRVRICGGPGLYLTASTKAHDQIAETVLSKASLKSMCRAQPQRLIELEVYISTK